MNRKKISSIIAIILLLSNNLPNVYATQATVSVSPVLKTSNITVNNNINTATDNLVITALTTDEIINVYSSATGGSVIASGAYIAADSSVTINTTQLNTLGGTIYVSLTTTGLAESKRTAVKYSSEISTTLSAAAITVDNLYGSTTDTVSVSGLNSGDAINLYSTAIGGTAIAGTVADSETSVSINPNNYLNSTGGTLYISVTKANKVESKRVAKKYNSEPVATALISSAITVTNNSGTTSDTISVAGLTPDDTIFAYTSATKGSPIASVSVTADTGTIDFNQLTTSTTNLLNSTGGTIYLSLKNLSTLESKRTAVKYASEISATLTAASITVNNVYDTSSDTVSVSGLLTDDVINVYSTATGSSLITSQTTSIINGLELNPIGGTVYVSVTKANKSESKRVAKKYNSEATATALTSSVIVNNSGTTGDTISIVGLTPGDTIFAYTSATKGSPIASITVAEGLNIGTIGSSQLTTPTTNLLNATGGTIYLSLKNPFTLEGKRTAVKYASEISTTLSVAAITITNNYGTSDTVLVSGLLTNDVINVYSTATGSSLITSGKVTNDAPSVSNIGLELNPIGGTVYVSVTNANKIESKRVAKKYNSETVTTTLISSDITVTNNFGITSDTITVTGLVSGDTIFAYTSATSGSAIASATFKDAIGIIDSSQLTTSTTNLLNAAGGTIYISIKNSSSLESKRTAVKYTSEISATLSAAAITVNNLYGTSSDTVLVSNLTSGDLINLYSAATGSDIIVSETEITSSSVSIPTTKLSDLGGTIYVSITSPNKLESARTAIKYTSVETSTALLPSAITVNNILGSNDTISIPNSALTTSDTINVYSTVTGGSSIVSGTLGTVSPLSISINTLNDLGGTIYVSVTSTNKLESTRTAIKYASVETSTALLPSSITVTNNLGDKNDTITISNSALTTSDTINLYLTATGGSSIASETGSSVAISTVGLSDLGGTVYVSVTSANKLESKRVAKTYSSDVSTTLLPSSITVTNDYETAKDNILVTGLVNSDSIKIYSAATGVNAFAASTATSDNVNIPTDLLSSTGGTIYVTITNSNKVESAPITITYGDEASTALTYNEVAVTNNYGLSSDIIMVTGLSSGDIVNLYSSDTATLVSVASIPVVDGSTSTTISASDLSSADIFSLNSTGGSIYLSVTNANKGESIRTKITYLSEPVTSALTTAAISVTDAPSGATNDNISISGLSTGDTISVYSSSTGGTSFLSGIASSSSLTLSSPTVDLATPAFGGGTIYVSIKKSDKLESTRTKKTYIPHI